MTNELEQEPKVVSGKEALAVLSDSEINAQIATAKHYPRSIKSFHEEALVLVLKTDNCIYALPRGGKTIEGASARFAEVLAHTWGNCRAGARIIAEDKEFVTAQGIFYDLERNTGITAEVKRRIVDKYGKRYNSDMVGVTANAACSTALRNAILKGIPKGYWQDIYEEKRKALAGGLKGLEKRRKDAVEFFKNQGITEEIICQTIGVQKIGDIGQNELIALRGIATAIQDGDTTLEQAFMSVETEASQKAQEKAQELGERLEKARESKEPRPIPQEREPGQDG